MQIPRVRPRRGTIFDIFGLTALQIAHIEYRRVIVLILRFNEAAHRECGTPDGNIVNLARKTPEELSRISDIYVLLVILY